MNEDQEFYVGQKAFVRKGDEVLIVVDPHEGLDYPGGKIQVGETDLVESLKREVREEAGLEIRVGEPFATWSNTFPDHHKFAGKKVYLVGYRCEYVSGDVTLSDEHTSFRWVTIDNYKEVDDGSAYFPLLHKYFGF